MISGEQFHLVFPQLGEVLLRKIEEGFKYPVHEEEQLAALVSVMVGVSLLFGGLPALLVGYA